MLQNKSFSRNLAEKEKWLQDRTSVIISNKLIPYQAVILIEMQKLAYVGLRVYFNGQAKELKCPFEQQEPAPVPDQIFKDFYTQVQAEWVELNK